MADSLAEYPENAFALSPVAVAAGITTFLNPVKVTFKPTNVPTPTLGVVVYLRYTIQNQQLLTIYQGRVKNPLPGQQFSFSWTNNAPLQMILSYVIRWQTISTAPQEQVGDSSFPTYTPSVAEITSPGGNAPDGNFTAEQA